MNVHGQWEATLKQWMGKTTTTSYRWTAWFEKNLFKFKDFRKLAYALRTFYRIFLHSIKETLKMSTCTYEDLDRSSYARKSFQALHGTQQESFGTVKVGGVWLLTQAAVEQFNLLRLVAVIKDAGGGPGGNVLIPSLCPEVGVLLCTAGCIVSLCWAQWARL